MNGCSIMRLNADSQDMDWAGVEQLGQFTFFPLIAPATKKTQIGLEQCGRA